VPQEADEAVDAANPDVGVLKIPDNKSGGEHALDGERISTVFAREGLVCGLLAPGGPSGDLATEFVKSTERADVVVLDWKLNRDEGEMAISLLQRLLDEDVARGGGRLRVVAVYTGELDLDSIARKLNEMLEQRQGSEPVVVDSDGMAMTKGPVRIVVLAKEREGSPDAAASTRQVLLHDLPDRLAEEFAHLTRGLIAGLGLASISALRSETHLLLRGLDNDTDAAYLGHRLALPRAADAEDHALDLVGAEIRSVLEDYAVKTHVGEAAVQSWLQTHGHLTQDAMGMDQLKPVIKLPTDVVQKALVAGLGSKPVQTEFKQRHDVAKGSVQKLLDFSPYVFARSEEHGREAERLFANQLFLRTMYLASLRELRLGTVVRSPNQKNYLLCIQPLCDSARLPQEGRPFPFVRLDEVEESKFQFTVTSPETTIVYLGLSKSPGAINSIGFQPKPGETTIVALSTNDGGFEYESMDRDTFAWVAELKPEMAQMAVFDIVKGLGRVGINESETRRLARS